MIKDILEIEFPQNLWKVVDGIFIQCLSSDHDKRMRGWVYTINTETLKWSVSSNAKWRDVFGFRTFMTECVNKPLENRGFIGETMQELVDRLKKEEETREKLRTAPICAQTTKTKKRVK